MASAVARTEAAAGTTATARGCFDPPTILRSQPVCNDARFHMQDPPPKRADMPLRVLIVPDVFPYPPDHGSSVISFHWSTRLAKRHHVAVLPLEEPPAAARRALEQHGVSVLGNAARCRRPVSALGSLLSMQPRAAQRIVAAEARASIRRAVGEWRADVVILVGPQLASALDGGCGAPAVFVPYDSVSSVYRSRAANSISGLLMGLEARRWARFERKAYPAADKIVLVTPEDAKAVSDLLPHEHRAKVRTVPNGVDVEHFRPSGKAVPGRVVATGNLGSAETVASIRWFVKDVWPRVLAACPHAQLHLVGKDCGPPIQRLAAETDGVTAVGYVPDMRTELAQSEVYVLPLRIGSGIRNRLLEALASGLPIVTTPLGARGLPAREPAALRLASTAPEFSAEMIELLERPAAREALGRSARALAVEWASWDAAIAKAEAVLREALGSARSA